MIPSLLVEIPHHQCVIWPHRDDLDGYHIKIPNQNDVTGQLALGNAYKIPHPKQEGISHRRHSSTPTGLYQVMHMKHITAKTHRHSWAWKVSFCRLQDETGNRHHRPHWCHIGFPPRRAPTICREDWQGPRPCMGAYISKEENQQP